MAIHYRDKQRQANPNKPTANSKRLLGVNDKGMPYFYWSEKPAEFAAYFGKNKPYWVWGQLEYGKHGRTMTPDSRVFIADRETALKLEKLGVVRPCKICNKSEVARYEADQRLQLNPQIEIELVL